MGRDGFEPPYSETEQIYSLSPLFRQPSQASVLAKFCQMVFRKLFQKRIPGKTTEPRERLVRDQTTIETSQARIFAKSR